MHMCTKSMMKTRILHQVAALLLFAFAATPSSTYADQNKSFPLPWFGTQTQRPQAPTFAPSLPWAQPRRAQPLAPAMPWFAQAQPYRNPFAPLAMPAAPTNPFMSFVSMPFSSGGMTGVFAAPMAQGMGSIIAPMAMNYAIASMNPTTMNNFFGLMANPNPYGSTPVAPFMNWGRFGTPGTYLPPAPRAYGAAPSPFPFLFGFGRGAH